jgi:hypothetical protein
MLSSTACMYRAHLAVFVVSERSTIWVPVLCTPEAPQSPNPSGAEVNCLPSSNNHVSPHLHSYAYRRRGCPPSATVLATMSPYPFIIAFAIMTKALAWQRSRTPVVQHMGLDAMHSAQFNVEWPEVDIRETHEPLSAPLLPVIAGLTQNMVVVGGIVRRLSRVALVHPGDQGDGLALREQIVIAINGVLSLFGGLFVREDNHTTEIDPTCSAPIAVVFVAIELLENARLVEEVVAGWYGHDGRGVFSRLCITLVETFVADSTRLIARRFWGNVVVGVVGMVGDAVGHLREGEVDG